MSKLDNGVGQVCVQTLWSRQTLRSIWWLWIMLYRGRTTELLFIREVQSGHTYSGNCSETGRQVGKPFRVGTKSKCCSISRNNLLDFFDGHLWRTLLFLSFSPKAGRVGSGSDDSGDVHEGQPALYHAMESTEFFPPQLITLKATNVNVFDKNIM